MIFKSPDPSESPEEDSKGVWGYSFLSLIQ